MIKAIIFDLAGVLIHLKGDGDFEIIQDNLEFVKKMKKKYKLGVLSNLSSNYKIKLKENNFYEIFDAVNLSGETGVLKPNKKSYLLILEKLKVNPKESVFIDDSFENIKAAKELGMKTILYEEQNDLEALFFWE